MKIGIGIGVCAGSGSAAAALPRLEFGPLSLIPVIGSETVAATRSTTVTALDNTPTLKTAQINEIASPGARRIHNPIVRSNTDAGWAKIGTLTATNGVTYLGKSCVSALYTTATVAGFGTSLAYGTSYNVTASTANAWRSAISLSRALTGAESVSVMFNCAGETRKAILTSANSAQLVGAWITVSEYSTVSVAAHYFALYLNTAVTSDLTVYSTERAFYNTLGNTNTQIPHEFVDGNTDYGAGVVGVKYSDRANGVSVSSNILTDATGAALTGIKGVLVEEAVTELIGASYYRDLTAWTPISGVPVITANSTVGIDGLQLADTLTGDAAGATGVYVAVTLVASTAYTLQMVLAAGTSTSSKVGIWDVVAGAYVSSVTITWTAGVPSTGASSGASQIFYTLLAPGFYEISYLSTTGANTSHHVYLLPDTTGTSKSVIYDWSCLCTQRYRSSLRAGINRTSTIASIALCPPFLQSGKPWSVIMHYWTPFAAAQSKGGNKTVWKIGDGATNFLEIYAHTTSASTYLLLTIGGSVVASVASSAQSYAADSLVKLGIRYSPTGGYSLWLGGVQIATTAVTTSAAWTSLCVLAGSKVAGGGGNASFSTKLWRGYASSFSDARMALETT